MMFSITEGALAAVAKVYTDNVKLLSQMDAALQPFVGDQQVLFFNDKLGYP